jgi:hypothetical protein
MELVYFLRSGNTDLFKIGFTTGTIEDRINDLSTGNPCPLSVFDVIQTEKGSVCETYIHKILTTKKFFGNGGTEFFRLSDDELNLAISKARNYMPTFIAKKQTVELLSKTKSEDRTITPTTDLIESFKRLLEIKEKIAELENEKDFIEFEMKIAIGNASTLEGIATWKSSYVKKFCQKDFMNDHKELFEKYNQSQLQRKFLLAKR